MNAKDKLMVHNLEPVFKQISNSESIVSKALFSCQL